MKKIIAIGFVLLNTLLFAGDNQAREIMQKVQNRDKGNNIVTDMKMVLIDKNNQKRVRSMKTFTKDLGDTTKTLIFFTAPSDVNNTAFLTYDYESEDKSDDQWLYLPALKKTKRIPSSDKSSSFMGSDFTYSDMTDPNLDDYNYKLIKEMSVKGKKVWLIESTPKSSKTIDETGYTKSVVYVQQNILMPIRGIHYLKKGKKKKYFQVKKLEQIDGVWFATQTSMVTKQGKKTLHKTLLLQNNIKFNKNMKESKFTVRTIEKGL